MTSKIDFLEDTKTIKDKKAKDEVQTSELYADVKVLVDYWDDSGFRHEGQSVVGLPLLSALQMLAEGKAERIDLLPTYIPIVAK